MRLSTVWIGLLPTVCLAGVALWQASPVSGASKEPADAAATPATWNRVTAASYMDGREVWWQGWTEAKRDHGTICISCHTSVPYALSRSALRRDLHESAETEQEKILLGNVEKRVSQWSEMSPFYSDAENGVGKTAQSHATEAVMNAVILTSYDKREGALRPITQTALDAAWALQLQSGENAGGWIWQDFHLAPWESSDSAYQGAALLMLEVGTAPAIFVRTPEDRAHIDLLRQYLVRHYAAQPLLNKIYVYWASLHAPGLLSKDEQKKVAEAERALQQPDGGWVLAALEERERQDKTPQSTASDGFATALVLLSMEAAPRKSQDASLERGLAWLEQHQEKDGRWRSTSLNKERNPESNIGLFMSDAATGYAVLALEQAETGKAHRGADKGAAEVSALIQPR